MKLASADLIVWVIIAIVVAVAKGIGKLSTPADEEGETEDTPVPPPVARPGSRARPPATLPSARQVARGVPPVALPIQIREMMERLEQPKRPAAPPPPGAAFPASCL